MASYVLIINTVVEILMDLEAVDAAPDFDSKVNLVAKELERRFPSLQLPIDEVSGLVKYAYDNKLVKVPKFKCCGK